MLERLEGRENIDFFEITWAIPALIRKMSKPHAGNDERAQGEAHVYVGLWQESLPPPIRLDFLFSITYYEIDRLGEGLPVGRAWSPPKTSRDTRTPWNQGVFA